VKFEPCNSIFRLYAKKNGIWTIMQCMKNELLVHF